MTEWSPLAASSGRSSISSRKASVVTLKVDDNTRMVFLRSAIQGPYAEAKDEPALKETKT